MENLNELVNLLTIKRSTDIEVGDYEYVRLENSYVAVLEECNEDELKSYIMSSDIPNPEHIIKLWTTSSKSVLNLLFHRLNVKDVGKYLENEIQCHPEMLPQEEIQEEIQIDKSLLQEEETKSVDKTDNIVEESFEPNVRESEKHESFLQDTENVVANVENASWYLEQLSETLAPTEQKINNLEEDLHYTIQIMEAIAEKGNVSIRKASNVLSSNEVLTVIASLKKFDDKTFRKIIEQTLLNVKTFSQSRTVTDFLSMLYECIEN